MSSMQEIQEQLDALTIKASLFDKAGKDRKKKVARGMGKSPSGYKDELSKKIRDLESQLKDGGKEQEREALPQDKYSSEHEDEHESEPEDKPQDEGDGASTVMSITSSRSPEATEIRDDGRTPVSFSPAALVSARDEVDQDEIRAEEYEGHLGASDDGNSTTTSTVARGLSEAGTKLRKNLPPTILTDFKRAFNLWRIQPSGNAVNEIADSIRILHDTVVFMGNQLNISLGDAKWPIQSVGAGFSTAEIDDVHRWLESPGYQVKTTYLKFWDHGEQKHRNLTVRVASEARSYRDMHIGVVEAGRETALRVFVNQNQRTKCVSCADGPRGNSASKKAFSQRGNGRGYLDCMCPEDTALLELWLLKTSAKYEVPNADTASELKTGHHKLDFHALNLPYVAAGIKEVSGLSVEALLQPKLRRLVHTLIWSAVQLGGEMGAGHKAEDKYNRVIEQIGLLVADLNEM